MSYPRSLKSRVSQRQVAEFYPYRSKRDFDVLKRTAARLVLEAKRTGALKPQPCEQCGSRRAEAHHEDYAKPLDVNWLCRFHHRRRDAVLRDQRRGAVAMIAAMPLVKPTTRRSLVPVRCTIALVRQATLEIAAALDTERISEHSLARRMSVSRQVVNQQFSAGFRSLKVLAAYAEALGYDAVFVLRKRLTNAREEAFPAREAASA